MAMPVDRRRFILTAGPFRHRRRAGSIGRARQPRRGHRPPPPATGPGCATSSRPRATGRTSRPSSSPRIHGRCGRRSRSCAARSTRTRSRVVEHGLFTKPREVRTAAAAYLGGTPGGGRPHPLHDGGARPRLRAASRCSRGRRSSPRPTITTRTTSRSGWRAAGAAPPSDGSRSTTIPRRASEDEIVDRLRRALNAEDARRGHHLGALVHRREASRPRASRDAIAEANKSRGPADRILLIVDGVHGFGVEDEPAAALGCDFFAAGTHKWIFGPRGTGIVWGRRDAWAQVQPTVPVLRGRPRTTAWMDGRDPGPTPRARGSRPAASTPTSTCGRCPPPSRSTARSAARASRPASEALNTRIKDGLAAAARGQAPHAAGPRLSAGLVAFEVAGRTPEDVVKRPRRAAHRRLDQPLQSDLRPAAGSLLNTPEEVDTAVRAVRELGAAS